MASTIQKSVIAIFGYCNLSIPLLSWHRTVYVWLHQKIEMLIPAKLLPVVFFKELIFTKYLFI